MKKTLFLFTLLSFHTIVLAQFNVGINAIFQLPQGNFKNISKLGYGGCAAVGYTFDQRIELSFVYTRYGYPGSSDFLKLNSKTVEAKFFFLSGNSRPYIGCGVGLFTEKFDWKPNPTIIKSNWGFEPKTGVLLNSKLLKNLFVDASVSWLRDNLTHRGPNAINFSAGLKYMINLK